MTQLDEDMTIIRHLRARIMVLEQENTKMKKELGLLSKIKESQNSTATHAVGIRQWGRGGNAGS